MAHAIAPADRAVEVDVFDVSALVAAGVGVVHIHFGFETRSARDLTDWADELQARGIALIHTAHDLDNPHLVDQTSFHEAVGVLVRRSTAVLTLTAAARSEIRRRYGVTAVVLPHPHIVDRALLERVRNDARAIPAPPSRRGAYVHASMMRANLDIHLIEQFASIATCLGGLSIHVRSGVGRIDLDRLGCLARKRDVNICVEDRLSDATLWARINNSSLLVLPYRWGTHSGLLEAARDLHVPVLAPRFGGFCDQGATPIDEADITGSVAAAIARAGSSFVTPQARIQQADALGARHADLYASVTAGLDRDGSR